MVYGEIENDFKKFVIFVDPSSCCGFWLVVDVVFTVRLSAYWKNFLVLPGLKRHDTVVTKRDSCGVVDVVLLPTSIQFKPTI